MKLLTVSQVAKLLCIHQQTVRNWDKSGVMKSIRTPGNQRRYREVDIKNLDLYKAIYDA